MNSFHLNFQSALRPLKPNDLPYNGHINAMKILANWLFKFRKEYFFPGQLYVALYVTKKNVNLLLVSQ